MRRVETRLESKWFIFAMVRVLTITIVAAQDTSQRLCANCSATVQITNCAIISKWKKKLKSRVSRHDFADHAYRGQDKRIIDKFSFLKQAGAEKLYPIL